MSNKRKANRRLRVVLYEPAGLGGICHYTYQLAEALERQGCRVTLVTSRDYELRRLPRRFRTVFLFKPSRLKMLLAPGVRLFRVFHGRRARAAALPSNEIPPALRPMRLRLLYGLLALRLLWLRPDVVHFQSVSRGRELMLVRLLARLGFRTLYTAHDLLPHDSATPTERRNLAAIYNLVGRIIVHAESNRVEMLSEFPVDSRKILIIPHGSYDFLLPEGRVARDEARLRVGLPAEGRIVLFFGLIKRYKGLEYLVEAFRQIEERVPDARLAIVGGLFQDADGYAFYRKMLEDVARSGKVTCVLDYVPLDRVGLFFCASDVVALPYTKTYQSGVLLAAYAAGRPVVVTDTGGLSEVVEEGRTGFVVPPRDVRALADAITRVLENRPLAAAMGEEASRLARTKYSWERIASETVRLYRTLVEERASRPLREGFGQKVPTISEPPPGAGSEESLR